MGIISWIIFGLIAGALARLVFPDRQPFGLLITMGLGIVGALVGGVLASLLGLGGVTGFNIWSFIVAVIGALIVLAGYEAIAGKDRTRSRSAARH